MCVTTPVLGAACGLRMEQALSVCPKTSWEFLPESRWACGVTHGNEEPCSLHQCLPESVPTHRPRDATVRAPPLPSLQLSLGVAGLTKSWLGRAQGHPGTSQEVSKPLGNP